MKSSPPWRRRTIKEFRCDVVWAIVVSGKEGRARGSHVIIISDSST